MLTCPTHKPMAAKKGPPAADTLIALPIFNELPSDQAQKHTDWIRTEMCQAITLDVPLKVDINFAPTSLTEK